MKTIRTITAAFGLVVAGLALAGCGESGKTIAIHYDRPAQIVIPEGVKKIAIAEFSSPSRSEAHWGEVAADKLASDLDAANRKFERYQLVDRKNLKKIMDERDLQLAISDSGAAAKAGKIANVDAIIYGSVSISHEDIHATKTVPSLSGGGISTRTVPYTRRTVTANVNFTLSDVQTGKTLATESYSETYDSDKDNRKEGFAGALASMGMGGSEMVPVDQAANILLDRCVERFVAQISPHEVNITEKLAKGKDKSVIRGNSLAAAGEYSEALDCYKEALANSPDDDGAAYNAGLVCEATGKFADAEKYYKRAVRLKDAAAYGAALARVRTDAAAASASDAGEKSNGNGKSKSKDKTEE